MSYAAITGILHVSVALGTAILLAVLGEMLHERVGILNLGVEGIMLIGAASGFLAMTRFQSSIIGLFAAIIVAGIIAFCYSLLTVIVQTDQTVTGLALVIFGTGFSNFIGRSVVGIAPVSQFNKLPIPLLCDIPFLGEVFFTHNILVYLTLVLAAFLWFFFFRTRLGLELRSIGEDPGVADTVGIKVFNLKCLYVTLGGMLMGAGGAYISLAHSPIWVNDIVAGRGWIAFALVIFSKWDPLRAIFAAYIFGGIEASVYRFQAMGSNISVYLLKMLPYIITFILLLYSAIRSRKDSRMQKPASLGKPYHREVKQ